MDEANLHTFVRRGQEAQRAVDRATDYSTWFTKVDAAARAGVTTKTIERWATDGKLQQAVWRRPNGPRLAVFHPGDVERLARELNPALPPFVLPPAAAAPPVPSTTALALSETSQTPAPTRPWFPTIPEAAAIAGTTPAAIEALIRAGQLTVVFRDRRGRRVPLGQLAALAQLTRFGGSA